MISVTAVVNRLLVMKSRIGPQLLKEMKHWRNFTRDSLLATEKIVEHAYILLHVGRRNLFHSSY